MRNGNAFMFLSFNSERSFESVKNKKLFDLILCRSGGAVTFQARQLLSFESSRRSWALKLTSQLLASQNFALFSLFRHRLHSKSAWTPISLYVLFHLFLLLITGVWDEQRKHYAQYQSLLPHAIILVSDAMLLFCLTHV